MVKLLKFIVLKEIDQNNYLQVLKLQCKPISETGQVPQFGEVKSTRDEAEILIFIHKALKT